MAKNYWLGIPCESENIEKILGEILRVKSCTVYPRPWERMGIEVNKNISLDILFRKITKVVKELKAIAKKSGEVWLATDEDREGEAISGLFVKSWFDPTQQSELFSTRVPSPQSRISTDSPHSKYDLVKPSRLDAFLKDRGIWIVAGIVRRWAWRITWVLACKRLMFVLSRWKRKGNQCFYPTSSFKIEAFFTAKM